MCAADGCPVAIEVFEGNTADPVTLAPQIDKLKQRFKLQRIVMVVGLQPTDLIRGDRGVLTSARIEQTLRPAGLDWITALRALAIKQLAAEGGPLQPALPLLRGEQVYYSRGRNGISAFRSSFASIEAHVVAEARRTTG